MSQPLRLIRKTVWSDIFWVRKTLVRKFFDWEICCSEKEFDQNFFLIGKKFWSEKFLFKKILVEKKFWSEKIIGQNKNVVGKKFDQKKKIV